MERTAQPEIGVKQDGAFEDEAVSEPASFDLRLRGGERRGSARAIGLSQPEYAILRFAYDVDGLARRESGRLKRLICGAQVDQHIDALEAHNQQGDGRQRGDDHKQATERAILRGHGVVQWLLMQLEAIAAALWRANHVAVLTGAGMSAESGVPTFRDAQTGLWAQYRPEDLATPEAFARQPDLVWRWYAWRRELVAAAEPHIGHRSLAALAANLPGFVLITQNVDGLHQRAGSPDVIELHGNIMRTICSACLRSVESWSDDWIPPRCPTCGSALRPDVVWFGESLPRGALQAANAAVEAADVMLVVGTSGLVEPAASLPRRALARGATVVEINLEPTPLTRSVTAFVAGTAGSILSQLADRLC